MQNSGFTGLFHIGTNAGNLDANPGTYLAKVGVEGEGSNPFARSKKFFDNKGTC